MFRQQTQNDELPVTLPLVPAQRASCLELRQITLLFLLTVTVWLHSAGFFTPDFRIIALLKPGRVFPIPYVIDLQNIYDNKNMEAQERVLPWKKWNQACM